MQTKNIKDFLVSGESFDLVYNTHFECWETFPQPKSVDLTKYYKSKDYISHTDQNQDFFSRLYQIVKIWSIKKKVKLISDQNGGLGSLLDIGAGTGDFLIAAEKKGWHVSGTEPNIAAAKLATEKGITLLPSLNDFEGRQFDVITLWHVLEHIPNLDETIEALSKMLRPHGSLIIAVPNFNSYDAVHYREFWAAFDVPRHLWHFSKSSMRKMFSGAFALQEIKPMIFDAFYVSLLSEKYKSGKNFSAKAIWIGLLSNIKAVRSKEYSSLIYCFEKVK